MATLKELMGDLTRGDGRKFKKRPWSDTFYFEPIFKEIDNLWFGLNQYGMAEDYFEDDYKDWELCTESKPKKKAKVYSALVKRGDGCYYMMGDHYSDISIFDGIKNEIIGWHEIEVEVDL